VSQRLGRTIFGGTYRLRSREVDRIAWRVARASIRWNPSIDWPVSWHCGACSDVGMWRMWQPAAAWVKWEGLHQSCVHKHQYQHRYSTSRIFHIFTEVIYALPIDDISSDLDGRLTQFSRSRYI